MSSAPISLIVGPRNLSGSYSDLSFTNVDPGGFEQLQATLTDIADIDEGDEVVVRCGMETAWHGRVNELGQRHTNGRTITQLAAVGYSAKLTDERMSMVYVDRDLSHWGDPSNARRVSLQTGGFGPFGLIVGPAKVSDATGAPCLRTAFPGPWGGVSSLPICEALYDAGTGNVLGLITGTWTRDTFVGSGDVNWSWSVQVVTNDTATSGDTSGNLRAAGPTATSITATTSTRRYGLIQLYYSVAAGGAGTEYGINWTSLAVFGNHGLTRRGSDPAGFYPADIVGHANTNAGTSFTLVADTDSTSFIVRHAAYRELVTHQQVITDMATLMGWHWGVWEPADILGSTPRLFFTAPPTVATVAISRDRITDLDSPRVRVDRLYDTASVKWQDPAGTSGVSTVTTTNPLASGAGVAGRTLELDMGQGTSASATSFGTFALALALAGARGGGSGTVPASIAGPYGARRPACLLRSGRDRIRITDLPDSGPLPESDANRQDSFLVRRVETTVKNGQPVTRIEFDGGADLLDVLSARLALAQIAAA